MCGPMCGIYTALCGTIASRARLRAEVTDFLSRQDATERRARGGIYNTRVPALPFTCQANSCT